MIQNTDRKKIREADAGDSVAASRVFIFATRKIMFAVGEHKFKDYKYMFKADEYKFMAYKYKTSAPAEFYFPANWRAFQNKSSQVIAFWIYLPILTYCNIWTVLRGVMVMFCIVISLFCFQNVSCMNF